MPGELSVADVSHSTDRLLQPFELLFGFLGILGGSAGARFLRSLGSLLGDEAVTRGDLFTKAQQEFLAGGHQLWIFWLFLFYLSLDLLKL